MQTKQNIGYSCRKQLPLTDIKIGSATVEEINNIKILGINFDKNLKLKIDVDMIAREISKFAGILFKLSKYLLLATTKTIYYSFINPLLLYRFEVW